MAQLGSGMQAPPMPPLDMARIVLADGSAEAVSQFCTEAMAVLQQLSSVASALGGAAGALAAAAGEVATNQRAINVQSQQIARAANQIVQVLSTLDMQPTVNVEAPEPRTIPPATVTVVPPEPRTKTVVLTDSQGRTVTGTVTET